MANSPLNPRTGGYKPSFIYSSFDLLLCCLPIPIFQIITSPWALALANPILRNLTFSSAVLTNCLILAHLKLRMSKPIVYATDERFSMVTLCAACVTLFLGLLFVLQVAILDPLAARAMGAGRGGVGEVR